MRLAALLAACLALAGCSMSTAAQWRYVHDPHNDKEPCLVWNDHNHGDRAGVYCRVYPADLGSR